MSFRLIEFETSFKAFEFKVILKKPLLVFFTNKRTHVEALRTSLLRKKNFSVIRLFTFASLLVKNTNKGASGIKGREKESEFWFRSNGVFHRRQITKPSNRTDQARA